MVILCFPLGHLSTFPRGEVFGAWPRSNPPLTCQTPGKQISYPLASLQGAENSWKVLLERWTPVVRVDLLRSEIWGHRTHLSWSLWSRAAKVLRMLSQAGLAKTQKKCTTLEAASFLVVLSFFCHVSERGDTYWSSPDSEDNERSWPTSQHKPFLRGNDFTGFPLVDEICSKNSDDGDSQHVVVWHWVFARLQPVKGGRPFDTSLRIEL